MARTNKNWPKLQEFQNDNPDLLIIIADPKTDEMSASYKRNFGFVRFPSKDMFDGVIYNALRESKFTEAIKPLATGMVELTGIDVKTKAGNEFHQGVGGSVKAIGISAAAQRSKLEVIKKGRRK